MTNSELADVLASYVPRLIQKRIAANPLPIESPVAEDLMAAVLFADISGFTKLTDDLAEVGAAGAEQIAGILNTYFGQLIDIVRQYGGDVVKFAGDAVIAVWPILPDEESDDLDMGVSQKLWTMRAAECAVEIRRHLSTYKVDQNELFLKLAISTGQLVMAHVGGVFNRWEFLLTGSPLVEVGIANNLAEAGDIVISPSAWRLIRSDCEAELIEFELKDAIAQGGKLRKINTKSSSLISGEEPEIPEGAESLLRPYIPGAIINRLTAGQTSWIAELRRATVLFINLPDINQNTELSEAQNIARLIQRSVYRYEGSINKISVDDKGITMVAAMGLPPFSHEDDPVRGLQAALMIRKELVNLKVRSNIGIATGRIFCGSIGNDTRREYTTIGNAVNLSARLMSLAASQADIIRKFKVPILCDRQTYEAAKENIDFESLPAQRLKGRSEPVDPFHPIEVKKSVIRPTTEMIGRQEEKTVIANDLQELSRGAQVQTLIVQGEAGIGKSRLFEDLLRQAETLKVKSFVSGGDSIDRSNPFHVWRPIFNKIFDIEELISKVSTIEEAKNTIQNKVIAKLQEVDPELVRYYPLLDVVLPIQIPNNELTSAMSGETRSSNLREVLVRLLSFEAKWSPLLIVLEDMHWFDSSSWDLLIDVQQKVRPVLLALNTRPLSDQAHAQFKTIQDFEDSKLIRLEAMMLDDVESLVCQRLGVKSVPPAIGQLIREKSEGHPFFAEELAYALRETGVLIIENQECRVNPKLANLNEISLPDSLQAAIINRIDSLNPAQQLTLKVASVIGRIFALKMLEAIYPIDTDRPLLRGYMDTLTRLSLTLVESDPPDLAYIFKHAVTQEVAYNLMLFSQRRRLHQAVAEWIEQTHVDNLDSFFPILAHHWTQAADTQGLSSDEMQLQKALRFLEKAGEQAVETYANREAVEFFIQALELESHLKKPENNDEARRREIKIAHWHGRIGLAYYSLGLLPDCDRHIREALKILGSPIPRSALQFGLGLFPQLIRQVLHRYFPSRYIGSLQGEEKEVALEVARFYEVMSRIYFYSNETLPILYTVLRFLNEAEKGGTSPELAAAYSSVAVMAGFAGIHPLAEAYVERGLSVSAEVNKPANTIPVNVVTGVYLMTVGKWQDVISRAREAVEICEQLGDFRQWSDATVLIGEAMLISGDNKSSLETFTKYLTGARERRNPIQQIWGLFGCAANLIRQSQYADAIIMLEEAVDILKDQPNLASSINMHGQLAIAYHLQGETEKALYNAGRVLELATNLRPTVYSLDVGFSAVATVYFDLWEDALLTNQDKELADKYFLLVEKILTILQTFKNVFPIGEAYLLYFRGWYSWVLDKKNTAMKYWSKGLESAIKYSLLYEEALIRMRLASAESVDDAQTSYEHYLRAVEVFESMGAQRELELARKGLSSGA